MSKNTNMNKVMSMHLLHIHPHEQGVKVYCFHLVILYRPKTSVFYSRFNNVDKIAATVSKVLRYFQHNLRSHVSVRP